MLKQSITYTNFNDETVTDILYFNLSKTELADNMWLKEKLEDLQKQFSSIEGDRVLEPDEIRIMLNLIKELMKLSYGERSEDGRRFRKSDELWADFQQTAAYDAFIYDLFQDPQKIVNFMLGIMPQDLRIEAEKEIGSVQLESISVVPVEQALPGNVIETVIPQKRAQDMTREELLAAMQERNKA